MSTTASTPWERTSVSVDWASAWIRTSTPASVRNIRPTVIFLSPSYIRIILLTLILCVLALYGRELEDEEEDEDEEDEEEQLEAHGLPGLLYHRVPQLLHYTAALHSRSDSDDDDDDDDIELEIQRERRGELRQDSQIGTSYSDQ